jgi:DICT domain-containing protein/predicted DNA-binding transcriptional regulator AlpA
VTTDASLTIREIAKRTGVAEPTLRMWESRYRFPEPQRLPSGHRRYTENDVAQVLEVARARDTGLSLPAAIERASTRSGESEPSVFAALRRRRPDLAPYVLPKRSLVAMSHAIEDECCARAERPFIFGSFQRERFYRASERRWQELARTAQRAIAVAEFDQLMEPPGAPVEVPLPADDPILREWVIACDAPGFSACLSAWEMPRQAHLPDLDRMFECVWTLEPALVREAAHVLAAAAARSAPALARTLATSLAAAQLDSAPDPSLVTTLTSRMVAYVARPEISRLPVRRATASD